MGAPSALWKKLRAFALALPEAHEDRPWGDHVAKVRKKIFVFLGDGEGPEAKLGFKLAESQFAGAERPG